MNRIVIHESLDESLSRYLSQLTEKKNIAVLLTHWHLAWQTHLPLTAQFICGHIDYPHIGRGVIGLRFYPSSGPACWIEFTYVNSPHCYFTHNDAVFFVEHEATDHLLSMRSYYQEAQTFFQCSLSQCTTFTGKYNACCPSCDMKVVMVGMNDRVGSLFHKIPHSLVRDLSRYL